MDPKTGSKRKHQSLSIPKKVDMLKKLDLGVSVRKLCEIYGIGFSTVYDIKKQRDKILKFYEDSDSKTQMGVRKTMKEGKSMEHDRRMMEWFRKWKDNGIDLTGYLIKEQAKMLHEELKLEHTCDYSEGWLQRFKKRHGIVLQKIGGERRSANSKEETEEENADAFSELINEEHLLNEGQVNSGELSGDVNEEKHEEWTEKNNNHADTQIRLYHMKTFSKSDDKKSKEKSNREVSCENLQNEEIVAEKDEENLSLSDLIKLLGNLIKGLGQQTFVTKEELMNFYLMHEKLQQERSKRLEKLRIHEMFKKITKRFVGSRLTSSSENPVPSTSAIIEGPLCGM